MKTLKIIKIGGHIIDDPKALREFLIQFSNIKGPKILVHGGGKLATEMANQMKVEVNMINGRRVTDSQTLDIITMVYAGKINKNIVAKLQQYDCNALGFTGADGNTIVAVKRPVKDVDYGYAGDIIIVNTSLLETLLNTNIIPVFCAITHDKQGQLLNTNADTIASELAIAFATKYVTELYYCFEKNGVLKDVNDDNSVIKSINNKNYEELLKQQIIKDGMLPKLTNCMNAIDHNVSKVCLGTSDMLFNPTAKYTTIEA
tara:strand:- start:1072 stop:1848 length:777 start_codon:yes stop_codon:yes gene_type:complete